MSIKKWNFLDILKFLETYKEFEILWNVKHKDNSNKTMREISYNRMVDELKSKGIDVTVDEIKNKIKIIRTVYRKELRKVEGSKKKGTASKDVYEPSLVWFRTADSFLRKSIVNKPNLELSDLEYDVIEKEQNELRNADNLKPEFIKNLKTVTPMIINATKPKSNSSEESVCKNKKSDCHVSANKNPVIMRQNAQVCDKVVENCNYHSSVHEDEFDTFAKYIATQIRKLPLRNAIIVQQNIQSIVTNELLRCIETQHESPAHHISSSTTSIQPPEYVIDFPFNNSNSSVANSTSATLHAVESSETCADSGRTYVLVAQPSNT